MKKSPVLLFALAIMAFAAAMVVHAQPQLPLPEASPKATVTQTIGISEVTVSYHRPSVKGRQVWGQLVPYGEVWRAGANENTTIVFSHDVMVEGKPLQAGTYGLHTIPTQTTWTIIFSKNATSWGSYFYKPEEDALRVTVTPQAAEHQEWLNYAFSEITDKSAVLSLHWEKLRVPIALAFDTPGIVIAYARDILLRGISGFRWQAFNQAAEFCLRNNTQLEQALAWADKSISMQQNFTTLGTKAGLLEKMGKADEAKALRAKSMQLATEAEINMYGYSLLNSGKTKDAIAIFEKNVKDYPKSWNVYDSLAEALEKSGDTKGAIKNYEKALSLVGDEQNKKRITNTITSLKKK